MGPRLRGALGAGLIAAMSFAIGVLVAVGSLEAPAAQPVDTAWNDGEDLFDERAALRVFERPPTEHDAAGDWLEGTRYQNVQSRLLGEDRGWRVFGAIADVTGVHSVAAGQDAGTDQGAAARPVAARDKVVCLIAERLDRTIPECVPIDDFVGGVLNLSGFEQVGDGDLEMIFVTWHSTGPVAIYSQREVATPGNPFQLTVQDVRLP